MSELVTTQKALSDLEILKKNLSAKEPATPLGIESINTYLFLNVCTFVFCFSLAMFENVFGVITDDLLASATLPEVQVEGIANIGVILLLSVMFGYAAIHYGATKQKKTMNEFTSKYFRYFKNISALSDIFVKFCCFALLILAGKPEWIAPLLLLFTADVILQGRFFILSTVSSIASGLCCILAAFAMYKLHIGTVAIPLTGFAAVNAVSLFNIMRYRKTIGTQE